MVEPLSFLPKYAIVTSLILWRSHVTQVNTFYRVCVIELIYLIFWPFLWESNNYLCSIWPVSKISHHMPSSWIHDFISLDFQHDKYCIHVICKIIDPPHLFAFHVHPSTFMQKHREHTHFVFCTHIQYAWVNYCSLHTSICLLSAFKNVDLMLRIPNAMQTKFHSIGLAVAWENATNENAIWLIWTVLVDFYGSKHIHINSFTLTQHSFEVLFG